MVYIREAHPVDGWQVASNLEDKIEFSQARSFDERHTVANSCVVGLKLSIPTVLDDMDNSADQVFHGWPERLYVLSREGRIVYQGGKGPYGFDIEELDRFLESYLAESSSG